MKTLLILFALLWFDAGLTTYLYYGKVVPTLKVKPALSLWSLTILRDIQQYLAWCDTHGESTWFISFLRYNRIIVGCLAVLVICIMLKMF